MHHTGGMGCFQSAGDLARKIEQVAAVQSLSLQNCIERLTLHQLAHDEVLSIHTRQFVEGGQIRMADTGGRGYCLLNPAPALGVARDLGRQCADRDQAIGLGVARLVDGARRAFADARQNLVVQKLLANHEPFGPLLRRLGEPDTSRHLAQAEVNLVRPHEHVHPIKRHQARRSTGLMEVVNRERGALRLMGIV